jgi:peptide/nickel transport system substrate-binding protein
MARSFYDTLAWWDENDEAVPFLAESIEPNEDFATWTITLRPGVTFHNGEPLTADAVKQNLEAHRQSALTGTSLQPIESIEVVDELTLTVTMNAPWSQFPVTLTSFPGVVMAPAMFDDPGRAKNPIGTGPFRFTEWVPDSHLEVVRNDDYWLSRPYLDGIEFRIIPENLSRRNALETGGVDVAHVGLADDIIHFQQEAEAGNADVYIDEGGEATEVFLHINQTVEKLQDPLVRDALILATDQELLVDTLRSGFYEPAVGIYAPDSPWHVETDYPEPDAGRAAELVAEWEAVNGPLTIRLGGTTDTDANEMLQLIASGWEDVGIDVAIESQELTQYINSALLGDYEVIIWDQYGSPHPDGEYAWLHSKFAAPQGQFSPNFGRNVNPEIDAAFDAARATDDPDELAELYGEIQRLLAEDRASVFVYHNTNSVVSQTDVHGIDDALLGDGTPSAGLLNQVHLLHGLWLEQ